MIILKSDKEIDDMKPAGLLAWKLLQAVEELIRPGVSTQAINDFVHEFTVRHNGVCAPLNYKGFPKSVCTSVNHVVCHGIPSSKQILKEGDIINIDVTPIVNGYHGDSSKTFFVGSKISTIARRLVQASEASLNAAIQTVKVGGRIGDVGAIIQETVECHGFSVVRDFVGHGIGKVFHEEPQIPHYGVRGRGLRFEPGMVFTIEPMINEGAYGTKVLSDGWTAVTVDGKLSAQFEHTIAIRSNGVVEILTAPPAV